MEEENRYRIIQSMPSHSMYRPLRTRDFDAAARLLVSAYPHRAHEPASWHAPAPHEQPRRWGAFRMFGGDPSTLGEIVGYAALWRVEGRKHRFDVVVSPTFSRQGIGGELFDTVMREARTDDAATLQARASEADADALAFLGRRGFRETMKMRGFVLDLTAVDQRVLEAATYGVTLADVSIAAVTSEQVAAPAFWARLIALHEAAREGWPDPDSGGEITPISPAVLRSMMIPQDQLPLAFLVASQSDRFVGYSVLVRTRAAGEAHFAATGVRPEARGRGVATALRARCLAVARAAGYTTVRSASGSDALIRINARFGFQQTHCEVRLVRRLDGDTSYCRGQPVD